MKKFFKLRNVIIIIIIIAVIFVIFYNKQVKAQTQGKIPTKYSEKTQTVTKAVRQDLANSITISGSIDAQEKTELRFQSSGQLAWIKAKAGDSVKKWQSLAGLDQTQLRKQLELDANNFLTTRTNFDDTNKDYKDSILTDEVRNVVKRNQYTLNNSILNYELQEITLKYAILTSPINGVITNVEQPVSGVNVTPANASISIINPETIYFRSKIDQEDVNKIKVGTQASLKIDSYSDEKINSKVTYIAFTPISGESSTVYQVKFEIPTTNKNSDLKYRIGMDGDAKIILSESKNAITLPIEAIYDDNGTKYVLIKTDDNKIVKRDIKTGIESDTDVEITEGLTDNESVIIKK